VDLSQCAGDGIHLTGTANSDSFQLHPRALSTLTKQRNDLLHGVTKTARHVGRDLALLNYPAVIINNTHCQFRTSNVNRSDQPALLSEMGLQRQARLKAFIKTN
jgi:hypothetical protein